MGCKKNRYRRYNRASFGRAAGKHAFKRCTRKLMSVPKKTYCVENIGPCTLVLRTIQRQHAIRTFKRRFALKKKKIAINYLRKKHACIIRGANLDGCRIVNLGQLAHHIHVLTLHSATCVQCKYVAESEKRAIVLHGEVSREGLATMLHAGCAGCGQTWRMATTKKIKGPTGNMRWQLNLDAVAGQVTTGGGLEKMNNQLAHMGVPGMSHTAFSAIEEQLGLWWAAILEQQMIEAGKEEKRLAEEAGQYFDGVPAISVIADGGWSKRTHKHSYVAVSGVAVVIGAKTGKILGMGVRTKFCATCRLAYSKGQPPPDHTCYKNWDLSSQAMEPDIILDLFLEGETKHKVRYMTLIADGDAAVLSTLQSKIPRWGAHIKKIECANHVCKNIRSSLANLVKDKPTYKGRGRLTNLNQCRISTGIRCAIKRRSEGANRMQATRELEHDILNAGYHVFGYHRNCNPDFCHSRRAMPSTSASAEETTDSFPSCSISSPPNFSAHGNLDHMSTEVDNCERYDVFDTFISESLIFAQESEKDITEQDILEASCESWDILQDKDQTFQEMMKDIQAILFRYAGKASRLIQNTTSNSAEHFMSLRAQMDGGKQVFRSQHGSFQHRCTAAALAHTMGPLWPPTVWKEIYKVEPNRIFTGNYLKKERKVTKNRLRVKNPEVKAARRMKKFYRTAESVTKDARKAYPEHGEQNECDVPDVSSMALEKAKTQYYDMNVKVTAARAKEIELKTRQQSHSGLWIHERHCRLTASIFPTIYCMTTQPGKKRGPTDMSATLKRKLYGTFKGNQHTKYGLEQEDNTSAEYIRYMLVAHNKKVTVHGAGIYISTVDNCLAGSPDGVVTDFSVGENGERGLVEFKNHSADRDKLIWDIFVEKEKNEKKLSNKWGDFCLRRVQKGRDELAVHKKHQWFYQVQGLMGVTGMPWCDLVVRAKDIYVERIYRNESLWADMRQKLLQFYNNAMLPELAAPRFPAKFRNTTTWVCSK